MTAPTLDAPPQPDLAGALWELVEAIPDGCVASYGQLAEALGDKTAARWVATELLHHEPRGKHCPCARVIRQGRDAGSYAHGSDDDKLVELASIGVDVDGDIVRSPWVTSLPIVGQPFSEMADWQTALASRKLRKLTELPDRVAGLDVSYTKDGRAVAACVVVSREMEFGKPAKRLWETAVAVDVRVPYVTGYLVFRELPALLAVYREAVEAGEWPGLGVIDGSGRLHPRRTGIATCFSLVTGEPTIGVTKKSLLGSFDAAALSNKSSQPIRVNGRVCGTAMQSPTGGKPVFVSPGEGISQQDADAVIHPMMTIHRVPEPIYWADRISRDVAGDLKPV